jgi:pimeloyl-ACP methyl ester carboxylesterase
MRDVLDPQFLPDVHRLKYQTLDMIRDGRLKAPTLVLWGVNDRSAPVDIGYQLFQHVSLATAKAQLHVFNRAGHYVFREHHRSFNRAVREFVRSSTGDC